MVLKVVNKLQKFLIIVSCLLFVSSVVFLGFTNSMYNSISGYKSKTLGIYDSIVKVCETALFEYNNRNLHNSTEDSLSVVKKYFPNETYGYSEVILKDISIDDVLVCNESKVQLLVSGVSESGSNLKVTWEFLFSDGKLIDFYTVR